MTHEADRQTRSFWPGIDKGAFPIVELDEAIMVSDKVSFEGSGGPTAPNEESALHI